MLTSMRSSAQVQAFIEELSARRQSCAHTGSLEGTRSLQPLLPVNHLIHVCTIWDNSKNLKASGQIYAYSSIIVCVFIISRT